MIQGRVQFIVRSRANSGLVNVLMHTISLSPGETLNNISLPGVLRASIRSDVIFTVSFSLNCEEDYYGPNCTDYCRPSDSDELGHYSCLSNGNIQCLQDYKNENTNCTKCAVAEACGELPFSSHTSSFSVSLSPVSTPLLLPKRELCSSSRKCSCFPGSGKKSGAVKMSGSLPPFPIVAFL